MSAGAGCVFFYFGWGEWLMDDVFGRDGDVL